MTSGQSGQGDPQGQPPPWQRPGPPPYGQSGPYGPPSYGQPPYGQQPHGYAPMPSAGFGGPPPEPRERPLTVRAGLGAFMVSIVLSVASTLFAWANWDEFIDQTLATQPQFQDTSGDTAPFDPTAFASIFIVVSLGFTAVYLLFVWFAWRGYNWARIVLWVVGGFGIASGLANLATLGSTSPFPFLTVLSVFSFGAVLAGVVLLARKPSSEWYAYEKWRRGVTAPR